MPISYSRGGVDGALGSKGPSRLARVKLNGVQIVIYRAKEYAIVPYHWRRCDPAFGGVFPGEFPGIYIDSVKIVVVGTY